MKACWFLLVLNFPGLFITVSQEEEIIRILKAEKTDTEVEAGSNGVRVIPGTRRIEDNLSDLRAQVSLHFCPHSHQITFFSELSGGGKLCPHKKSNNNNSTTSKAHVTQDLKKSNVLVGHFSSCTLYGILLEGS